jgi:hypothetical protein
MNEKLLSAIAEKNAAAVFCSPIRSSPIIIVAKCYAEESRISAECILRSFDLLSA